MPKDNKKKLIIIYGTRTGSTEEIVQRMNQFFNDIDVDVDTFNIVEIKDYKTIIYKNYDGILLGSGIRVAQWTKKMKTFLETQAPNLNSLKIPYGIFVSCASSCFSDKEKEAKKLYLDDVISEYSLEPVISEHFGGVFDFTKSSKMGFMSKKMLKMVFKSEGRSNEIDLEGKTDLRDWNKIKSFVDDFSQMI